MSGNRSEVVAESKRKAVRAGVVTATAVTLGVIHFPVVVVAAVAVPAAMLSYRWWKHRAENGIRF